MGINVVLDDRLVEDEFPLAGVRSRKDLLHLTLSRLAPTPEEGPDKPGRPPPYTQKDSTTNSDYRPFWRVQR